MVLCKNSWIHSQIKVMLVDTGSHSVHHRSLFTDCLHLCPPSLVHQSAFSNLANSPTLPQFHILQLPNMPSYILQLLGSSESMNLRLHLSISIKSFYLCVWVIYLHICATRKSLVSLEVRTNVWFPRTGVPEGCELPCGMLRVEPMEEHPGLSAVEPSP